MHTLTEEESVRLKVNSKSDSSEELSDISREEMKWNSKNSDLLLKWSLQCSEASEAHGKAAKKFKMLYGWFGLPPILIPIALGILQPYLNDLSIVTSILMVLTGSLSGISTFFDFSQKRSKHEASENSYNELFLKIEAILAIPRRNRNAADVTITEMLFRLNALNAQAPPL